MLAFVVFVCFVCLCNTANPSEWKNKIIYQVLIDRFATDNDTADGMIFV